MLFSESFIEEGGTVISFRPYSHEPYVSEDAVKVRDFLIRINATELQAPRLLWGAWDWAVNHALRDQEHVHRIGMWEDEGRLVALATYELNLGEAILVVEEGYDALKPELVAHTVERLHSHGDLRLLLPDEDECLQLAALETGFRPTRQIERFAKIHVSRINQESLPHGFSYVSLADEWDWRQYNQVIWRGFDHDGNAPDDAATIAGRKKMLSSPAILPELILAIASPEGKYVAHCGVWYRPGDRYSYVEPVVTDPTYRGKGFGKSVVYEAIIRSGKLGAEQAIVASDQTFYYNIGFVPFRTMTQWQLHN